MGMWVHVKRTASIQGTYPNHPAFGLLFPLRVIPHFVGELIQGRDENIGAKNSIIIPQRLSLPEAYLIEVFARLNSGSKDVCGRG